MAVEGASVAKETNAKAGWLNTLIAEKKHRSTLQHIWLEIPSKEIVKSNMDERWKRQDGYYPLSRLLYELDVNSLKPAVQK